LKTKEKETMSAYWQRRALAALALLGAGLEGVGLELE